LNAVMIEREWKIVYTKHALKDKETAYENGFGERITGLLALLKQNPYTTYPSYEKLVGELSGAYSRRINHQHRLVYTIHEEQKTVKIISLWEHYQV
jgi:toxin YoeB